MDVWACRIPRHTDPADDSLPSNDVLSHRDVNSFHMGIMVAATVSFVNPYIISIACVICSNADIIYCSAARCDKGGANRRSDIKRHVIPRSKLRDNTMNRPGKSIGSNRDRT